MWMKPLQTFGENKEIAVGKYDGFYYLAVRTWDRDRMKFRYLREDGAHWTLEQAIEDATARAERLASLRLVPDLRQRDQ